MDKSREFLYKQLTGLNFSLKDKKDTSSLWVKHHYPCKNLSILCLCKGNDENIWFLTTSTDNAVNCEDIFNTEGTLTMCNIDDLYILDNSLGGEYVTLDNREMPFWRISLELRENCKK